MSSPQDDRLDALFERLAASGLLEPLAHDPSEERTWVDHDLASLVEHRFGVDLDPQRLTSAQRDRWLPLAAPNGLRSPHRAYTTPFWIVDGPRRVGTVAVASVLLGRADVEVFSLYINRQARGRGHAGRALDAVYQAALAAGLYGVRLSTEWLWQPTVRFYLRGAMWVYMWKRDLVFVRSRTLPRWRIEVDGDHARFLVTEGEPRASGAPAATKLLLEARRQGPRLAWTEHHALQDGDLPYLAPGTFAVALAVRGFPLITSDEAWREQLDRGHSDAGGPEGLAFKIRRFEAWARKEGYRVETPRIPGLDYPDWDDVD